jgi:hypothetical protein
VGCSLQPSEVMGARISYEQQFVHILYSEKLNTCGDIAGIYQTGGLQAIVTNPWALSTLTLSL